MCGIAGIIDSVRGIEPDQMKRMTDVVAHRGPDAEGFLFVGASGVRRYRNFEPPDGRPVYALGHRRLSIIDLEGGAQPLCNEDETIWIVYNGEIYNHPELRKELTACGHSFRTHHSDTEVILHAYEEWGVAGMDRMNGIFAFGILDLKKKKLILARDHFGVKPIYYFFREGRFCFSSEIKAILECRPIDRRLDPDALNDFLSFRYVPSPRTTFRDIFKIEAGGFLEFDLAENRISSTGNYTAKAVFVDHDKSFSQCVEAYRRHFETAVKRQLISDVEIGVLLSGGVDSSAVCAVAAGHIDYPLRTYTVGFNDFPDGNELKEATEFAKHLGTLHKNVVIDDVDFIEALDEAAWFMDEPTATSSTISLYYLTREIRKDVKVVLTGQGADEPLSGYPRYWGERLYHAGFKYLGGLCPLIERLPRQELLKRAFRSFRIRNDFERYLNVYSLFNAEQKKALMKAEICQERNPLLGRLFDQYTADDSLGRMLYIDTRSWLPDDLLIYGDKATMRNGIEARVPILDKDLVYFIESLPSRFKLSWKGGGKYIHRKACEKWLPPYVINRPKKGFATPIDQWFRKEMGQYVRERLLEGTLSRSCFNSAAIEEMIQKHQSGKENFQRHLFALLMLEKWAEAYHVRV